MLVTLAFRARGEKELCEKLSSRYRERKKGGNTLEHPNERTHNHNIITRKSRLETTGAYNTLLREQVKEVTKREKEIVMGFKEVMALRQEGNLTEALTLAQKDYQANQDQWSASALFWVLKDLATQQIKEEQREEAQKLLKQMEEVVGYMGATTNVALESLATLRKEVVPHYSELTELAEEARSTKNRVRVKEIFATACEWLEESNDTPDEVLHPAYAEIIYSFLSRYYQHIPFEEFEESYHRYLTLRNQRPSELHSKMLKVALEAKKAFGHQLKLVELLDQWNLSNLRQEDWSRGKGAGNEVVRTLGEKALFSATTELTIDEVKEVPESIYLLLNDALTYFPDDSLAQLSRARIMALEGSQHEALIRYELLLQEVEEPMAWAEYAYLISDPEIRLGALSMALREEKDDYREYITKARIELARLLIQKEMYQEALRELTFVAQICLEKAREVPSEHATLMAQIPSDTEQSKDNKELYYTLSRPAMAHIYRELPEVVMMVYDVMAMRIKDQSNQVVPMLKLMTPEGKTALVTPKEAGILPGDNRGKVYMVKLLERHRKHTKVVQLTLCEECDPKELFPTQVGIINGYSEALHAYHVMDSNSRHHYLPGQPNEYTQGEFISFVLLIEKQIRKGTTTPQAREFIYHIERVDPTEAILTFNPIKATVEDIRGDQYLLQTEQNTPSFVNHSVAPVELSVGDHVIVRGFQQRHKDRYTGQAKYSFVTLSIEPYFEI